MRPSRSRAAPSAFFVGVSVALTLPGCLDLFAPDVGPLTAGRCNPEDSDPETDVSFTQDVLPLLSRSRDAAGCACHDPGDDDPIGVRLTGLDLSTYEGVLRGGVRSGSDIVVPGDPCISVLFLKPSVAPPFGSRMPLSGPPFLTAEEHMLIHDWIAEGADDD